MDLEHFWSQDSDKPSSACCVILKNAWSPKQNLEQQKLVEGLFFFLTLHQW